MRTPLGMTRWRRSLPSVRIRVTLTATLAALVVGLLGSTAFVLFLRSNLESALLTTTQQQVSLVVSELAQGDAASEVVSPGNDDVVIQVVAADGSLVASDPGNIARPLTTSPGSRLHVRIVELRDRFAVRAARADDGRLVVVARSDEQVRGAVTTTVGLLAVAVPIGLALLALAVWLAVGRALRPVEAMRRQAEAITSEDLHQRLAVPPGRDEIPRLATTLNELLDRLEAFQQRQRQFVSDASHELRSPLAAVRQLAEVARRHPTRVDVADLAGDVLTEERRMEDLVGALLVLARLDDGDRGSLAAVDLDDVVLAEVARLRAVGDGYAGPALDTSRVGAGQVRGNAVLLAHVVRNLLGNARRHAASRVEVEVREAGGRVVLVVEDDGGGVPADQREAVFERFVRLDESRSRDAGGSGLGLAIVRKAAQDMAGTVTLDEAPSGGARFTVVLPAASGT